MTEGALTTLITSGFIFAGTVVTAVISYLSNKTSKSTADKIDAVEAKLDAHIKDDEWATAKQCRVRILRFDDEIYSGIEHSENHYEEILDDIDFYERFCKSHPEYVNNKGQMAMAHIKAEYKRRKANNNFLGGEKNVNVQ